MADVEEGVGQPEAMKAQSCKAKGVQAKLPQEGWQPAAAYPHCLSLSAWGAADNEDSPEGRNVGPVFGIILEWT